MTKLEEKLKKIKKQQHIENIEAELSVYKESYYALVALEHQFHVNSAKELSALILHLQNNGNGAKAKMDAKLAQQAQQQANTRDKIASMESSKAESVTPQPQPKRRHRSNVPHIRSIAELKGVTDKPSILSLLQNEYFINMLVHQINNTPIPSSYRQVLPRINALKAYGAETALKNYAKILHKPMPTDKAGIEQFSKEYIKSVLAAMHIYFKTGIHIKIIAKRMNTTTNFFHECHNLNALKVYNKHYGTHMLPPLKCTNIRNVSSLLKAMFAYFTTDATEKEITSSCSFSASTLGEAFYKKPIVELFNYEYPNTPMLLGGKHPAEQTDLLH